MEYKKILERVVTLDIDGEQYEIKVITGKYFKRNYF